MSDTGKTIALIKTLAGKIDPSTIEQSVSDWLDDHPEATTTVEDGSITKAKLHSDLQDTVDDVSQLKNEISILEPAATSSDVGKFLKAKTVSGGKVPEYEFGSGGGGSGSGAVDDVQVNGVSVVSGGVANVPVANAQTYGVIKVATVEGSYGVYTDDGILKVSSAKGSEIKTPNSFNKAPIVPWTQHLSTFYGLAKAAGADMASLSSVTVGVYPEAQKSAISEMLNAPETVSGTTPSITAKPGVRYICGECTTLTIVAPASGCIDVVFESGSTPTVLTVSSAKTGVSAIKWANGFDPTSLDADTTYEINILDGEFGVVGSWT